MTRTGRLWPWAMAALLGVTVAGNIWVMRIAAADPSFAIEPDYYAKAVTWDSTRAQAARNGELGWTLTAELLPPDAQGRSRLTARLVDADGRAVGGASLRVEALHLARATEVVTAALEPADGDTYAATIPAARRGLWELRFEAMRDQDRFTATLRTDTTRDPAP